jgi:hypothetical protein
MRLNMNILLLKSGAEEIPPLAHEALRLAFGTCVCLNALRFASFNLQTLRAELRSLGETDVVLAFGLPIDLRREITACGQALEVGTIGWSLGSLPVYVWDLLGGPGGEWVSVGRMRAQALPDRPIPRGKGFTVPPFLLAPHAHTL